MLSKMNNMNEIYRFNLTINITTEVKYIFSLLNCTLKKNIKIKLSQIKCFFFLKMSRHFFAFLSIYSLLN